MDVSDFEFSLQDKNWRDNEDLDIMIEMDSGYLIDKHTLLLVLENLTDGDTEKYIRSNKLELFCRLAKGEFSEPGIVECCSSE